MPGIRLFKTFCAVASEGSFAAAAARVALTQAAVGQQMRALEAQLRRPLFERQGKSVVLNEAGRALLPQARKLLALHEQLLAPQAAQDGMAGTVHLGAVVSAVRPLVQATLALKARHPQLDLHVSAAKSMELLERVQAGALDAGLVVRDAGLHPDLAWTALYDEPMVLLAPRAVEAASPRELLRQQPFIRFDRAQHTGRLVERTLRRLRVKPREILELNALESMVELVRSGLGVAVVPLLHHANWAGDARLRVLELPGADRRRIGIAQRRDTAKPALLAAVARELQVRLP